ncbi:hypothetical protein U1Q18_017173, partial [Sarracenia purpurea var. burkii]
PDLTLLPPSLSAGATTPSTTRDQTLARSETSWQKSRSLRSHRPPSATPPETMEGMASWNIDLSLLWIL